MGYIMSGFFEGTRRQVRGLKVGLVGLVGNLVLFGVKIVVGWLSGSIAVVVDSVNNFLDSASSVITVLGFRFAARKGDRGHPHGHGRVEYIAAFVISIIIIVTAILLGAASVGRIISPVVVESSTVFVVVMGLAVVGKGLLALFYILENRKIQSEMLTAAGRDAVSDILATSVTLVALVLAPLTEFPVDGVAGLTMSVFILWLGGKSFGTNFSLLIGRSADRKTMMGIRKIVLSCEAFAEIESLDFHDYGPESREALVKVRLAPGVSKYKIERDIDLVQQEMLSVYSAMAVIYWAPKG